MAFKAPITSETANNFVKLRLEVAAVGLGEARGQELATVALQGGPCSKFRYVHCEEHRCRCSRSDHSAPQSLTWRAGVTTGSRSRGLGYTQTGVEGAFQGRALPRYKQSRQHKKCQETRHKCQQAAQRVALIGPKLKLASLNQQTEAREAPGRNGKPGSIHACDVRNTSSTSQKYTTSEDQLFESYQRGREHCIIDDWSAET